MRITIPMQPQPESMFAGMPRHFAKYIDRLRDTAERGLKDIHVSGVLAGFRAPVPIMGHGELVTIEGVSYAVTPADPMLIGGLWHWVFDLEPTPF